VCVCVCVCVSVQFKMLRGFYGILGRVEVSGVFFCCFGGLGGSGLFLKRFPLPIVLHSGHNPPQDLPLCLKCGWVGGRPFKVASQKLDSFPSHSFPAPEGEATTWSVGEE
jgi:hypothetical protein